MKKNDIARVAHEINRAFCQSIGDFSQPDWNDAPEWQKSSALNGVQMHLDNPEASPSDSHDSWLKEKTEAGWTFGGTKDPVKKTHPCIIPYSQLPVEQQSKDFIFRAVVHSLKSYLSE